MVVDARRVNAMSEATQWPMMNLEAVVEKLSGAKVFFSLDLFKGFWATALSEECREMFSFMTHDAVYTPTRSIQGAWNSSLQFQARMAKLFRDMKDFITCWIDDLLGHASTEEELLDRLEMVFNRAAEVGLKFSAKKSVFFARSLKWCGRIFSGDGVSHDPERIAGLVAIQPPDNAKDLQQFLYSVGWMRTSIPDYTRRIQPLQEALDRARVKELYPRTKKRKFSSGMKLVDYGWGAKELKAFEDLRDQLKNIVQLAYPDPKCVVCVFPDASSYAWGSVITQIPAEDVEKPVEEQRHQPLAFFGKRFTKYERAWAIVDKEGFAIHQTLQRGDYLVRTGRKFLLYTDHANLVYIFRPPADIKKHTAERLQRWALQIQDFDFQLISIAGDRNVWADLISRWLPDSGRLSHIARVRSVKFTTDDARVYPMDHSAFSWPTAKQIRVSQRNEGSLDGVVDPVDNLIKVKINGKSVVRIPDNDVDLQCRLVVIAHSGAAGHHAFEYTMAQLERRFFWKEMKNMTSEICGQCLHCITNRGGSRVPRPWGEQIRGKRLLSVLHMDWLYVTPPSSANHSKKYILVLKDDFSGYVWCRSSVEANARVTAEILHEWIAAFKAPDFLVSDCGSHFMNEVLEELCILSKIQHHIVVAYSPFANGSVERVNKEILKVFRAIMDESKLADSDWPYVLPVVQHSLNHMPTKRNGGHAPFTVLTQEPAESPLDSIFLPDLKEFVNIASDAIANNISDLRAAVDAIHQEVKNAREIQDKKNRKQSRGCLPNFIPGDFVLVARPIRKAGDKLRARWTGPHKIVRSISTHVFEVEKLATHERMEVHINRLRYYADSSLHVTEEIIDHAAANDEDLRLEVEKLIDAREHHGQIQLLVSWKGFEDVEMSWEPIKTLLEDIPTLVKAYIRHIPPSHHLRQRLRAMSGIKKRKRSRRS